jgi:hypothetical protein
LLFIRAANRLRELTTQHDLSVQLAWDDALVQPPNSGELIITNLKMLDAPDRLIVENLATRLRPFMLNDESCSFPYILKRLRRHVEVQGGPLTFDELAAHWNATLNGTTAPLPAGTKLPNIRPGVSATAKAEGQMTITFDREVLTGREAIALVQYGELVHIDPAKEKKLLRIRRSEIEPGFRLAVISVAATLSRLIDILRFYAEGFIQQFPPATIADIENKIP